MNDILYNLNKNLNNYLSKKTNLNLLKKILNK